MACAQKPPSSLKCSSKAGSSKKQESSRKTSISALLTMPNPLTVWVTSWEIDEETVETVAEFILGGFKITADGDCSHEIKRHFLLGKKL